MTVQVDVAETPQHMLALAKANGVRLARAALKENVKTGRVRAADVLLDPPGEARTMLVVDLLRAQHRWERTRARRVLAGTFIPDNKQVGALTERQARLLVERLGWL